jgi:hypothetical protein
MTMANIEKSFRDRVSNHLSLIPEGKDRYRVFTPFLLEDGDHLAIVLHHQKDGWVLTDEGHTYMHLTYFMDEKDFRHGTRQKIIENALEEFQIEDRNGALTCAVEGDKYGDALYSYIQALLKINNITFLSRERVRSTFLDDFRLFFQERVPQERLTFEWHDPGHDPDGIYSVDCRINGMDKPIVVFALPGDDKTRDATIALHTFERWGLPHRSLAVFEDQEEINRKVLARFSDVCEKQFSNLPGNRDRIEKFIQDVL